MDTTNPSSWRLYRVSMIVRPSVHHPSYYQLQIGILFVYIYAPDMDGAQDRAEQIVDALPYEAADDRVNAFLPDDPEEPELMPDVERCRQMAQETGMALFYLAAPPGCDEQEWIEHGPF